MKSHLIGIDEVGRGPIAGPVAAGTFVILDTSVHRMKKVRAVFKGVKESKQLSEEKREKWFGVIGEAVADGFVDFQVTFVNEKVIDAKGIAHAIRHALKQSIQKLVRTHDIHPKYARVLLDGGLKAPAEFIHQKTIIKGDAKEMCIALASICAKVLRDRRMRALAKKYPEYGFDIHKGYGTKKHYDAIQKYGVLPIHRRSFLKRLQKSHA